MYTFAADSGKLETLAKELDGNIAILVKDEIEKTYRNINNFGDSCWSGESYESFKEGCGAYQDALRTIPDVLNDFGKAFRDASKGVQGLQDEVKTAMQEIN